MEARKDSHARNSRLMIWLQQSIQVRTVITFSYQPALRPALPRVYGPLDYREQRALFQRIDWVLLRDAARTLVKATVLVRKHGLKHRMPQEPLDFLSDMNILCMKMSDKTTPQMAGNIAKNSFMK
jgi:hypothetical protein